jgi:hypothetical protein
MDRFFAGMGWNFNSGWWWFDMVIMDKVFDAYPY